jgi:hypothetical protein
MNEAALKYPKKARSSEHCSKVGRIGGLKRIELHGNPQTAEGCVTGGKKGGKRRFELYGNPLTAEDRSKGGVAANHFRWHLGRGREFWRPDVCELCAKEIENETKNIRGEATGARIAFGPGETKTNDNESESATQVS